jgi:geranylgeranyl transferase type-2 subunit alpha
MAPRLSDSDRLDYICREMDFVREILEDVTDCKWVYQTLIECKFIARKISGSMSEQDREQSQCWLKELKQLDPLRTGRWDDLEASLQLMI